MRTPSSDISIAACRLENSWSGGAVTKNSRRRESIWDAEPKRSGDRHARSRVPAGRQSRQNRLIEVLDGTGSSATTLVRHTYDALSRRISTTVSATAVTTLYVYDGWNCIAEYTIQDSEFKTEKSYLWGLDLSGSLQGAGGVGGMLALHIHTGSDAGLYYPCYDGNGNITEYLTANGDVSAHYEYDPFGNDITPAANTGDLHDTFAYRFSTKPLDPLTGLYYYGYRWYDPLTGRWQSRDPIGEDGGLNLYGFVGNSPENMIDRLGWEAIIPIPESFNDMNSEELMNRATGSEVMRVHNLPRKDSYEKLAAMVNKREAETGVALDRASKCHCGFLEARHSGAGIARLSKGGWRRLTEGNAYTKNNAVNSLAPDQGYQLRVKPQLPENVNQPNPVTWILDVKASLPPEMAFRDLDIDIATLQAKAASEYAGASENRVDITPPKENTIINGGGRGQERILMVSKNMGFSINERETVQRYVRIEIRGKDKDGCICCKKLYWARSSEFTPKLIR